MLNKIRKSLCPHWATNLRTCNIFITIWGLIVWVTLANLDHKLFTLDGDYTAVVIMGLMLTGLVAMKLIIDMAHWQFRKTFGCDAPRRRQQVAQEKLQPMVDAKMMHLVAAQNIRYRRFDSIRARRLKSTSTIESRLRKVFLDQEERFIEQQCYSANAAHQKAARLAEAFRFTVADADTYLKQMRQQDKKTKTLAPQQVQSASVAG